MRITLSVQGSLDAVHELLTRDVQRTEGATIIALMTVVAAFTAASCSATPAPPTRYNAALFGKLVMVNNCLRVDAGYSNGSYLLIWPPEFDVGMSNYTIDISDRLTAQKAVWHIGDIVTLGGGNAYRINDGERPLFSANCLGPYWIVGGIAVPPTLTPAAK